MTYQLFHLPKAVLHADAVLQPGWKVSFFLSTTTTPTPVYTTSALSVAHTQPVEADAAGVLAPIYLNPSIAYKASVYDEDDVLQYTVDPVNDAVLSQGVIGALLYPQTAAESSAGVTPTNYAYPVGHWFRYGIVADGDGAGGGTNNAAAIQVSFNLLRDYGVQPIIPRGVYRCDSALALLNNDITPFNWVLEFNGAVLDFTNLGTSGDAWSLGATSEPNAHDKELIDVYDVTLIGPETENPISGSGTPDGSTVGLSLEYALNVRLHNVQARRFYKGFTSNFCFHLQTQGCITRENYIGFEAQDASTLADLPFEFIECVYAFVAVASASTVSAQNLSGSRFENVKVAMVLDPGTTGERITGITCRDAYVEDLTHDFLWEGIAFTYAATPSRGADRAGACVGTVIGPFRLFGGVEWDASQAPAVWATTPNARGGRYTFPAQFTDCENRPLKFHWSSQMDNFIGDGMDMYPDFSPGEGGVTFTGAAGAIGAKWGNANTVTKNATGDYTITPFENYAGGSTFVVTGTCHGGNVQLDNTNSSSSAIRILTLDNSATPAAFDPDSVRIRISGPLA